MECKADVAVLTLGREEVLYLILLLEPVEAPIEVRKGEKASGPKEDNQEIFMLPLELTMTQFLKEMEGICI